MSSAAAALNQLLPAALQLPTEHLVALAAGVNSNAYGISNPSGGRTANVGFVSPQQRPVVFGPFSATISPFQAVLGLTSVLGRRDTFHSRRC